MTPSRPASARLALVLAALVAMIGPLAFVAPSASAAAPTARDGVPSSARTDAARGIDVSGHQHPKGRAIDFAKVRRAGFIFAFVKATEGRTFINEYARVDGRASVRAGLTTGFYHFARPASNPVTQARHFVREVRRTGVEAPLLVLDLEESDGKRPRQVRAWATRWLTEVERITKVRPIIYTGPTFWRSTIGSSKDFARYPLWVAHYGAKRPTVPAPWRDYAIWQHSATASVPGVPGRHTDVNVAPRTTIAALRTAHDPAARAEAARKAEAARQAEATSRGAGRPAVDEAAEEAAGAADQRGAEKRSGSARLQGRTAEDGARFGWRGEVAVDHITDFVG